MCILCIEIAKGNMTNKEIARAYTETVVSDEHATEILDLLSSRGQLEDFESALFDIADELGIEKNEDDPFDVFLKKK